MYRLRQFYLIISMILLFSPVTDLRASCNSYENLDRLNADWDRESLHFLNNQAKLLWNSILDCNGNSEAKARKAYLEKNYCTSRADNKNIREELFKLNELVEQYFTTSIGVRLNYQNAPRLQLHPLLLQLMLQRFSTITYVRALDGDYDVKKANRMIDYVRAIERETYVPGSAECAVWPNADFVEKPAVGMRDKTEIEHALFLVNFLRIFFLQEGKCDEYSLDKNLFLDYIALFNSSSFSPEKNAAAALAYRVVGRIEVSCNIGELHRRDSATASATKWLREYNFELKNTK